MDKRDEQELFIPPAGSYMNPVNQPPPPIPPPSYDSISTPTAPYPIDSKTNETGTQQSDKNVQNKGLATGLCFSWGSLLWIQPNFDVL